MRKIDTERAVDRTVTRGATRMTHSEAFVETLVANGVTDVFGIVGSAYMDALDLLPAAALPTITAGAPGYGTSRGLTAAA